MAVKKKDNKLTRGQKADAKRKTGEAKAAIAWNNKLKGKEAIGIQARKQTPSSMKAGRTYKG